MDGIEELEMSSQITELCREVDESLGDILDGFAANACRPVSLIRTTPREGRSTSPACGPPANASRRSDDPRSTRGR